MAETLQQTPDIALTVAQHSLLVLMSAVGVEIVGKIGLRQLSKEVESCII